MPPLMLHGVPERNPGQAWDMIALERKWGQSPAAIARPRSGTVPIFEVMSPPEFSSVSWLQNSESVSICVNPWLPTPIPQFRVLVSEF